MIEAMKFQKNLRTAVNPGTILPVHFAVSSPHASQTFSFSALHPFSPFSP
jgi:hypothetical protein